MATAKQVQQAYLTYFGRPSDPEGQAYWSSGANANLTQKQLANIFAASEEYASTTAGKTVSEIINSFYSSLFGRDADATGLQFWTNKVTSNQISVQLVGLAIGDGAIAARVGSDYVAVTSKLAAADGFTAAVARSTFGTLAYAGALAATYGVEYLKPVLTTSTIPSSGQADTYVAGLPPAGTIGLLSSSSSSVAEGGTVIFTIETIPKLSGKFIAYQLSGIQAADIEGGNLAGSIPVNQSGFAVLQVTVKTDSIVELGESITITFPSNSIFDQPPGSNVVVVNDTTVPNLQVAPSATAVSEAGALTFFVTSSNLPAGTVVNYTLSGAGLTSADVNGAPLTSTVALNASGRAEVTFNISADLSTEGAETVTFTVVGGGATASAQSVINDTSVTPVAALQVAPSATAVNEGGVLTFFVTSTNIPVGTFVTYTLSGAGLTSADVNGAPLTSTVALNASGRAEITFNISADLSTEGAETVTFTVVGGGATASAQSVINDTSVTPAPVLQAVLTTGQDISGVNIAAPPAVGAFTYFANEQTLGQFDLLSRGQGSNAQVALTVGTTGNFDLSNFTLDGIQTLKLTPSDSRFASGEVDLQTTAGLTNIEVSNSRLDELRFDDIQSTAGLRARLTDTFSSFVFNFDANALIGVADRFDVTFSEAPVDATTGGSLGLIVNQGPVDLPANLETLGLESIGSTVNVIDQLQVGPVLRTLEITGTQSLHVLPDIGFDGEGNTAIRTINAAGLVGDLTGGPLPGEFFTYTSLVAGNTEIGADVTVAGATGVNRLQLLTAAVSPTDFLVVTNAASDFVITDSGNDQIVVAEGDNTVDAGNGNNSVIAGSGNDSIVAGAGNDFIVAGAGDNTVDAGNGNNTVFAGTGNDSIDTGLGNDSVDAGNGNNTVNAGIGNDTVLTLGGNDSIDTGVGNDSVNASDGDNTVSVGFGNDTVLTGSGNDVVDLCGGDDSAATGAGNDSIAAGTGSNTIVAGDGSDTVDLGIAVASDGNGYFNFTVFANGADSVDLGGNDDLLRIGKDNLTDFDSINGGSGNDTIQLWGSGTLGQSETNLVSRIEQFTIGGTSIIDPIVLDDELVRTSDNLGQVNGVAVQTFTVQNFTAINDDSSITLDLTQLSSSNGAGLRTNIVFIGEGDDDRERVRIDDVMLNRFTQLSFAEQFTKRGDDFGVDTLQIVDGVDATADDFNLITGVDSIELTATAPGQVFNIQFDSARFDSLVGRDSLGNPTELLITATPSLNGAVLNLDITNLTAAQAALITVAGSSQLALNITGTNAGDVNTEIALFYTPSTDIINTGFGRQFVFAEKISDVQTADQVDLGGDTDEIEFRFGLGNVGASLQQQLSFTSISNVEELTFAPVFFNQPVNFTNISTLNPFALPTPLLSLFAPGLETINTANGDDQLLDIEREIVVNTFGGNDTVSSFNNWGEDNSLTVDTGAGFDSVTTFGGADSIVAGNGNNTVNAGNGNNTVSAGTGDDEITTGFGEDFIDAGNGNNTVDAGDGRNTVITGTGNDSIVTGFGNDTISAGAGNNTVDAGNGNNTVFALDGNDSIVTGTDKDSVSAGDGNNTVSTSSGRDFVITGLGNDSINTSLGSEIERDTVFSGAGNDSILVGFGDDSVNAGADNDLIVLSDVVAFGFIPNRRQPYAEYGSLNQGLTLDDRIDGGAGFDVLATAIDTDTSLDTTQLTGIEQANVSVNGGEGARTLTVESNLFADNGTLRKGQTVFDLFVAGFNAEGVTVDADALVQGQAINATVGAFAYADVFGGAGNDQVTFDFTYPGYYCVQGNGGSDSISLVSRDGFGTATIVYATGNDGGQGGTGTGGDLITGYSIANDQIIIIGGLLGTGITGLGGLLSATPDVNVDTTLVLGGLSSTASAGNNLSGRNVLSLTGPSRSLTDAELSDAARIASNINGVGVTGNGLAFGEVVSVSPTKTVDAVTNQALIIQQGQTNTAVYLYTESSFDFDVAQSYTVEANELRQLGIFQNTLFTGNELTV